MRATTRGELVVVAQVKQSRRRAGDRAGLNWQEERGPMIITITSWPGRKAGYRENKNTTGRFYSYEEFKNCRSSSLLLSLSRSAASFCTFSLICSKRKVPQVKSGAVAMGDE